MAKVDEATLTPDAANSARGGFVIRRTRDGTVIAKWPRRLGKWRTPGAFYQQQEFATVARGASSPEPVGLATSINLAKGTHQVPRDLAMMAAYGKLYELTFADGTVPVYYRMVAANAQLTLDQVTDTPGAMLYRSPAGWLEIPPGNNGDVLWMFGQVPQWLQAPADGSDANVPPFMALNNIGSNTSVNNNTITGTGYILQALQTITNLHFWANAASASSVVTPAIYGNTSNAPGALLTEGSPITGIVAGINTLPLTTPYVVPTTGFYFPCIRLTGSAFNQWTQNGTMWGFGRSTANPLPNPMGAITSSFAATWIRPWFS
jgi:hypothetical protein